jgi:adhesin transport system outer membrane protein
MNIRPDLHHLAIFALVICLCELGQSSEISLTEVMRLVSVSHPQLEQQSRLVDESSALIESAGWQKYPNLSFDYGTSDKNSRFSSATLSLAVYDGGVSSIDSDIQVAEKGMREARLKRVEHDLLISSIYAFFGAIRAKRSTEISQRSLSTLGKMRTSAERRVKADMSPPADLNYLDSQIALQRLKLSDFRRDRALALSRLREASGKDLGGFAFSYITKEINNGRSDIVKAAYLNSANRLEIESKIRKASLERDKRRAAIKPKVSLNYKKQFFDPLVSVDSEQLYLSVNFNTGRGLSYSSEVAAGSMRLAAMRDEAVAFKRTSVRDTESKLINLERLILQIPALKMAVEARKNMVSSYSRLFTAGTRSWLDLLNAHKEKYQAEIDLDSALLDLDMAKAELRLIVGEYDY